MAMARKKPRLATVPEVRYSAGEDAVDFMQIRQEPDTPEMAARRHGSILSQNNLSIFPSEHWHCTFEGKCHKISDPFHLYTYKSAGSLKAFIFLLYTNLKIPCHCPLT